jgi:hypothetical protein
MHINTKKTVQDALVVEIQMNHSLKMKNLSRNQ